MKELFDLLKNDPKTFFKELAEAICGLILLIGIIWIVYIFRP